LYQDTETLSVSRNAYERNDIISRRKMMENILTTISGVKEEIGVITDNFYQQKNNTGYQKLIPVIDMLTKIADYLDELPSTSELIDKKERLQNILQAAMGAMDKRDTILLADILKYDVCEFLTELD
jgi:hypothetical protein